MTNSRTTSFGITPLLIFSLLFLMGAYFVFAAVQGDYGIFRRVQVESEIETLRVELDVLEADVASLRNKTHRLSDSYLDLDLLDTQARATLGLMRSDEILLR